MNHLFRLVALLALAVAGSAHAFTLGDIRYYPFANGLSPFVADLGGVSGT